MKPITDVIREKEAEMQHVREEIEALMREKELRLKALATELETLNAAARIIAETAGGQPQAMAAAAPATSAPVEPFPVQSAPAPEPARKRWP